MKSLTIEFWAVITPHNSILITCDTTSYLLTLRFQKISKRLNKGDQVVIPIVILKLKRIEFYGEFYLQLEHLRITCSCFSNFFVQTKEKHFSILLDLNILRYKRPSDVILIIWKGNMQRVDKLNNTGKTFNATWNLSEFEIDFLDARRKKETDLSAKVSKV